MADRIAEWIQQRARLVLVGFIVLTALLALASIGLGDNGDASQEPDADVFTTRDDIQRRLPPLVHTNFIIVEAADGGDILRAEPLAELLENGQALRAADSEGLLVPTGFEQQPLLADRFDTAVGVQINGFVTLAEVVESGVQQQFGVSLSEASDDMVKVVVAGILAQPETASFSEQISVLATEEQGVVLGQDISIVRSPGLIFEVDAWNEPLGGGQFAIGPSGDPVVLQKEEFNLNVERYLRGEQESITVWGVAVAANETSEEQGKAAAPFIVLAVVTAVLIVGIALRSYWATALTGIGLAVLMIWLGGISSLIGLKGGLVIELLVPISMIALGVDFAVHSMSQYQHVRYRGARTAFRVGLGGVLGALTLAAATDSVAFLSNASSGIESIAHFAIAASIATVSSFVVLGIIAPLTLSVIDGSLGVNAHRVGRFRYSPIIAAVNVAILAAAAAIVTLAVSPIAGVGLTVVAGLVSLLVPYRFAQRQPVAEGAEAVTKTLSDEVSRVGLQVGRFVAFLSSHTLPVMAATLAITGVAIYGALQLEGSFKIQDFFSADTDFVVSVEKIPEHVGTRGGESNQILIEGDLTEPAAWASVAVFVEDLADNSALANDLDGALTLEDPDPLSVLRQLTASASAVQASTGVLLTDTNQDGLPDTSEQIVAAWSYALASGVPSQSGDLLFTAADVRTIIDFEQRGNDATVLAVRVPDASDFAKVHLAGSQIQADAVVLEESPHIERVAATGSGLGRIEVIDASTRALWTAIPIAVVAVFLVLLIGLRSLRYALVTTLPMLLVASWLYGTMALFGFALNFVTATIGAISIGVGADYAIHMTERYRQERSRYSSHVDAARAAAESTGVALLASAASTAIGFLVLALAPMPLFATFGLLTALMVVFALIASLVVLPPLLALVARNERPELPEDLGLEELRPEPVPV